MAKDTANVLELAVLGLLSESPMHGYELRKKLTTTLGTFRALLLRFVVPDACGGCWAKV